jgi:glyoxylase-like metal-dependent hydrolase (beta-lactamase superfamily II)
MLSRRTVLKTAATVAALPFLTKMSLAEGDTLTLNSTRSNDKGLFRAPTLLMGKKEAILIDGGFNYPDGDALVEEIKASGKKLTQIYISQSDPDFYFGLTPVKAAFPDARVIAASETIEAIQANVQKKLDVWGPQLGEYGPQKMEDVVFAEVYDQDSLNLEGTTIEIVTASGMANRRYLWIPSLNAIVGGVLVFDDLHVWTADTATPEVRASWIDELNSMLERNPEIVVAGHAAEGVANGAASLTFTRDYLMTFEEETARAENSEALIAAMQKRYPGLGLEVALQIGAKVATGEMVWG